MWEGYLEFNTIKSKLTYLVVIGRSTVELHQTLQQHLHLLQHPIPPIPNQPAKEEKSNAKMIDSQPLEPPKEDGSLK